MEALVIIIALLGVASLATIFWLSRAPLGYEDDHGFHRVVEPGKNPTAPARRSPALDEPAPGFRAFSSPPF